MLLNFGREPVEYRSPASLAVKERLLASRVEEEKEMPELGATVVHLVEWQSLVLAIRPA